MTREKKNIQNIHTDKKPRELKMNCQSLMERIWQSKEFRSSQAWLLL